MAVGIQSASQYSYRNSGYAFIEATSPSITTDSQGDYLGAGKLISSPNIFQISQGSTFTTVSEEYRDAQRYNQLISMGRVLDAQHYSQWVGLVQKYGMKVDTSSSADWESITGSTSQSYTATCNVALGQYCEAGSNCCQSSGICYSACPVGTWDPMQCVCVI